MGRTVPLSVRFWDKVNKDGPVPPHRPELGPCWVWTGGCKSKGYGRIRDGGTIVFAHRVAWELAYGPIPFGLKRGYHTHCCHHCDNPGCVRAEHMFLGTIEHNTADKVSKGRQARGTTLTANRTTPSGDAHWMRLHPDKVRRGDAHPRRLQPDRWKSLEGGRSCNKKYDQPEDAPDPRKAHGAAHGMAVLTEDKVRSMRERRRSGASFSQLVQEFGVSIGTAHKVISGKTWRHILLYETN